MTEMKEKPSWYDSLMQDIRKMFSGEDITQEPEEEKDLSAFIVEKQADGTFRWFGWVTNKWQDREGDILVNSAHEEFLKFLDENPEYAPALWTWHTTGTDRENKADWWDYTNGFFMYSGLMTEEEAEPYVAGEMTKERIGMSHGFYVLEKTGRYIRKYRTFEVSELPHDVAANAYTDFDVKKETNKMFTDRKRAFLVDRYGEEKVAELETSTEDREKMLETLGVSWKEINDEYEAEIEKEHAKEVAEASKTIVQDVVKQVVEALNIEGLQETLKTLHEGIEANKAALERIEEVEEKVSHLMETEDARIAKALTPDPFDWTLSVTGKDKSEAKVDDVAEQVAEATGEFEWLKQFDPSTTEAH